MNYQLALQDNVILTTTQGSEHNAVVLAITAQYISVILAGFGTVNMLWDDLVHIYKLTSPIKRQGSFGPHYKIHVWSNNKLQLAFL